MFDKNKLIYLDGLMSGLALCDGGINEYRSSVFEIECDDSMLLASIGEYYQPQLELKLISNSVVKGKALKDFEFLLRDYLFRRNSNSNLSQAELLDRIRYISFTQNA